MTTFYSATGGLRSVVTTDIFQFFLMMLGTLCYAVVVVRAVGGLSVITDRIHELFAAGGPGGGSGRSRSSRRKVRWSIRARPRR